MAEQYSLTEDYENIWKFTGHELDKETGNYYAGARYYNPKWSVWLSVDPLADHPNQVDKSPYAYTWNNPVNLTDPDGRCPKCPKDPLGTYYGFRAIGKAVGSAINAFNERIKNGKGFRIWGNSRSGHGSTQSDGKSSGPDIDVNDLPTPGGGRGRGRVGDGKTNATTVTRNTARSAREGAEAGGKVDDGAEATNKAREAKSVIKDIVRGEKTENDTQTYRYNFFKDGMPYGSSRQATGEEGANQLLQELEAEYPDFDLKRETVNPSE